MLWDFLVTLGSGLFVFLGSVVDLSWWLLVALWMVGVLIFFGVRWVVLGICDVVRRARRASAQAERDDFLF
jgi:hypothetical protein